MNTSDINHVSYAINEPYVDYCLVSIISIFENNKNAHFHFHILTDKLSEKAKERFNQLVKCYDSKVSFYLVDDSAINGLSLNGWGKYAWYRLFLPELLPNNIHAVLYLDTDTIVCGDISELYRLDLTNYSLAGCMDIMGFYDGIFQRVKYGKEYGYICSGVILFNLDYFRQHDMSRKIFEYSLKYPERINFPDQDAINGVCHKSMKLLPLKYDMLAPFFTSEEFIHTHLDEVKDMLSDPKIIHYAGCNPWIIGNKKHYFYDKFWEYANMIGGIKPKYGNTFFVRIKIMIKMILGIMGVPKFKKFKPKKQSDFSLINKIRLSKSLF